MRRATFHAARATGRRHWRASALPQRGLWWEALCGHGARYLGQTAGEYIDSMLFRCLSGPLLRPSPSWPSMCSVANAPCAIPPAPVVCNACVARFAQPSHRCTRCALVVPAGVPICGACLKEPPAIDTCLAAVPYGYPWAQAIKAFKFHNDPGWAKPLATPLRSTPWIEPALEAADWVIPILCLTNG